MPTGYTAPVADGTVTTLRDYALLCARNFLVSLRDLPSSAPIPGQVLPDMHHAEEADAAWVSLQRLHTMTLDQQKEAAEAAYTKDLNSWADRRARLEATRERYEAMLNQLGNWPSGGTPEGLRNFMLTQLIESRDHDTYDETYDPQPEPDNYGPRTWHAREVAAALRDFSFHTTEHAKELSRAAETNAWLQQLWASLPAEENHE